MRIGIVGHAAEKFTPETEAKARAVIRSLITPADVVISGGCHMGGVDVWAIEEAKKLGCQWKEYVPTRLTWSGEGGFQDRNLKIARDCDKCVSIVVAELPPDFKGMKFEYCYHCNTKEHVKSGGCWTVKQAIKMGKIGQIMVI